MQSVLFLCHRLPWPPNKGDKIRSYHVLRRLAEHYRVYLGTFVDDSADWPHVDAVEALCADVCVRPLNRWASRWRALMALLRGRPLTVGVYRDRVMRGWIDQVMVEHKPDVILCYSSGVAPLAMPFKQTRRVMDFVDADSDKWRQYARAHHGVMGMVYRREARRLAALEAEVAEKFDASVFVSAAEAAFFRRQVPALAGKIHAIANGVDADYWNPDQVYANPYPAGVHAIVFVGAMDYRANVHAAQWFASQVWPRIHRQMPHARFYIVGSNPSAQVRALGELDGITVTGRVDDVRPWLAHAHAVTAPLRIARGIQNKVLEAMAMEKVILATPEAWEGIADFPGREGCISDDPETIATQALSYLRMPCPKRVPQARGEVMSRYAWEASLDAYEALLRPAQEHVFVTVASAGPGRETCS
ncbi:TIGR03087 family PEP-CTERM/XrtA system glycosyltransferase [Oleiagrimonas sp. C23AA]|uniref:TIGR03087 family PEP-CTERM/XrtA system glycosyltransferase n=1 Tax=Oleiagrimonas sp. C23AA TaxID=2719047 RepID=UPI00141F2111|nr:TIGR03087 family PEP-CTERM/XrtA system glycosyltransferase [Oleiagrimonas sp. C23AA]NII11169.1 TIGR03087 family PEP-CTERM/XrtA system glycosyltransferase [Oleiagrimonas sp. C23AA]